MDTSRSTQMLDRCRSDERQGGGEELWSEREHNEA